MRVLTTVAVLLAGAASAQPPPALTGALSLLAYGTNPCTGADDHPAFTAAIAAAAAAGGGTVVLPAATCLTSATITVPENVRLVGQGKRSQITPTASMPAVIQITGGLSSVETLALQANGTLAPVGILVAKSDSDVLQTDLIRLSTFGFGKAVKLVSGHTVTITGGFFLNNAVAFSYEPGTSPITNMVITGGTLVQGGSGIDLPANITGTIYPHVEGLLVSDLQVVQGVDNAFCLRMAAGVHVVWRGGLCAEARTGGYGFRLTGTPDPIRSVDIGDVFIGTNPAVKGALAGISIAGPATAVKIHDVHLSSWRATPIAIDGGSGTTMPGSTGTAVVSIARPSFDNTTAAQDITVAHAAVTVTQPQYDIPTGLGRGAGATVASWP